MVRPTPLPAPEPLPTPLPGPEPVPLSVPTPPTPGEPITEAWGDVVHDMVVKQDIQTGTGTMPAGGSSTTLTVTFPRQFVAAPIVLITPADANGASQIIAVTATYSTGVQLYMRHRADGNCLAAKFNWLAIGPRL